MADFEKLCKLYQQFPGNFRSLMLSTATADGIPQASYAPFLIDADKTIYLYLSGLSTHTNNLKKTGHVSVLFIEDEGETQEIFARRRLTYQCVAGLLPRDTSHWSTLIDRLEQRFGNVIGLMKDLPDFQIFKLQPQSGRFVVGFGAAYQVDENNLEQLKP